MYFLPCDWVARAVPLRYLIDQRSVHRFRIISPTLILLVALVLSVFLSLRTKNIINVHFFIANQRFSVPFWQYPTFQNLPSRTVRVHHGPRVAPRETLLLVPLLQHFL